MTISAPHFDLQHLKSRVDCQDIARAYLGEPKSRSGKCVVYPAPHRDDNRRASFAVYSDGFKDFGGDGASGDAISLIQLLDRSCLTFADAKEKLAQFAGETIPLVNPLIPSTPNTHECEFPSSAWQTAALREVERGEYYLWSKTPAARKVLEYLHTVRGLSDEQIRKARLGYNPHRVITGYQKEDDQFAVLEAGITIPWFMSGNLVAVRIRTRVGNLADWLGIEPDTRREWNKHAGRYEEVELDKYLSLAGSKPSSALYWSDHLYTPQITIFVEGEFDCLLGDQIAGDLVNFVTRGSASSGMMPESMRELVEDTPLILSCLDNDIAGRQGTHRLITTFPGKTALLPLPVGKDLTEFVVDHKGDLRLWLQKALALIESAGTVTVPDGVRCAALRLKLIDELIVFELVLHAYRSALLDLDKPLAAPKLKEIGETLHIDRNVIDRGLKGGVGWFFSELDISIPSREEVKDDSMRESEKNPRGGRPRSQYRLLHLDIIRARLSEALRGSAVEGNFPMRGSQPIMPPIEAEMLEGVVQGGESPMEVADELKATLAPAYQMQNEVDARRRQKKTQADYTELKAKLDSPYSTPLQPEWLVRSKEYQKQFLRASVEAGDLQNIQDVVVYTGVGRSSVPKRLKAAGLGNEEQFDLREITTPDITHQACKIARGRGRIVEFVAKVGDQAVAWCKFDPETVDVWGQRQKEHGAKIFVKIQLPGKLFVEGEAEPAHERLPRVDTDQSAQPRRKTAKPRRSGGIIEKSRRNQFGYRNGYVRGVLWVGYKRINDLEDDDVYSVKMLRTADVVNLVRLKAVSEEDAAPVSPNRNDAQPLSGSAQVMNNALDEQSRQRLHQLAVASGWDGAIAGSLVKLFQGRDSLFAIRPQEIADLYEKLSGDDQRWLLQIMPASLYTVIGERLNVGKGQTIEAA